MPGPTSEYARVGVEQGFAGQRVFFRAAVKGSGGDIARAAETLGLRRDHLAREARRLGMDWDALLAEARGEKSDPPESNAA